MSDLENDHFVRGVEYGIQFAVEEFLASIIDVNDYSESCFKTTQFLLDKLKEKEKVRAKRGKYFSEWTCDEDGA